MYTFDAIILEKNIIREKQIRLVVLTKEYGKITLWYHKQLTGVDIWDIARVVVRRDESVNRIRSIDTKKFLLGKKWNFETLFSFLTLLKVMKMCILSDEGSSQIFSDYEKILQNMWEAISIDALHLLQMRIFKHLGSLNPNFFENDSILWYMYEKIAQTPLEKILKTKPLTLQHRKIIEKSNYFSLSTFIS